MLLSNILEKLQEATPIKNQHYIVDLKFNPLATPNPLLIQTIQKYKDDDSQHKAVYDLKTFPTTVYTGQILTISPRMHLRSSLTTMNSSLSTLNVPITIVITAATTSSVTIGFKVVGTRREFSL